MSTQNGLKKMLQAKVKQAKKDGFVIARMAQEMGVKPRTLYDLVAKAALDAENAEKIRRWLHEHNYLSTDAPIQQTQVYSRQEAETLLRDFLELVDSGLLDDNKFWRLLRLHCESLLREMPQRQIQHTEETKK